MSKIKAKVKNDVVALCGGRVTPFATGMLATEGDRASKPGNYKVVSVSIGLYELVNVLLGLLTLVRPK